DKKAYAIDCEKLAQLKSQLDEKLSTKNRLTRTLEQIKSEKELSFFTFNGDRNDAPTLKAKMEQFSSERARISVDLSLLTDEKYNAIGLQDKEVEKWQKFSLADSHLVEELEKFEQTVALAQKNLDEVKKNNAVAVIRASLTEGDECPVCHGKITGVCASQTQELDELEKALELAVGTRDKLRVQKENSGKVLATISTNLENYKKQIDETSTKIAQKEKELGELNKTFTVRIEQLAKEFCEVQKQIDLIDTEISKVENDCAQMQAKVEVVGETLKATQKALASEKSAICGDETAVDNQLKEAKERIKLIEQSRETVQAKRKEYDEGIKVLVQKRNTCEGELKTLQANYKPVEKVDEKDLEGAKATASQCREKLDAINKELGTKGEKIKVLTENLAKKKGFETGRKKLETECKKYADLSKMFYGDGFRNFIVGEFIKEVTEVASIKLASLTGGKYTLEYDGDFFVYDFLSNNEKRSCKTLSGGETFLASLALAIAISNELSKSKNFDFFFIDEGFGTLSPEALDTVVDALKELSKDTLVGVITHRGELIDRIDLKIEVTSATEDEGSKISYK
ncbi:MAG: SMC family ATPase, partial [Clostridia bacterium]|nr:SMC family ATPase [Clostridia bacterium]